MLRIIGGTKTETREIRGMAYALYNRMKAYNGVDLIGKAFTVAQCMVICKNVETTGKAWELKALGYKIEKVG